MRILITGASGFIGSHLLQTLSDKGHEVVSCVRQPEITQQRWPDITTIQVDFDRMMLGKFHPVDVPLWGEIGRTLHLLSGTLEAVDRPEVRAEVARRWDRWRSEKRRHSR